jgi:hypothetical protein
LSKIAFVAVLWIIALPGSISVFSQEDVDAYEQFVYTDETLGMEAFRLLIPKGWQAEGRITWTYVNPAMPAAAHFRFFDPRGAVQLEILPARMFSWMENPMFGSVFKEGSAYQYWEARRPLSAVEYLEQVAVENDRSRMPGLRIVERTALPELPDQVGVERISVPWSEVRYDGGKIRIEYEVGGKPVEEELYAVVTSLTTKTETVLGKSESSIWSADYRFCCRAARGMLETERGRFEKIVKSIKINPLWLRTYNQVVFYGSQYRNWLNNWNYYHYDRLGRTLSETSDILNDAYWQRQRTYDRIMEKYSRAFRGENNDRRRP